MDSYNALWFRPGLTMAGVGQSETFDPGTGPGRYERALARLNESGKRHAFASFTFDPDQSGSIVVIPETVIDSFEAAPAHPNATWQTDRNGDWQSRVERGLSAIADGEVEKVVLARHRTAGLAEPVDIFSVAAGLMKTQPECQIFAVADLVGASPELLLRISGNIVESVPLAGSAISDIEALATDKSAEEHSIAADSVSEVLTSLGIEFSREDPRVLDVGSIQHLATRFVGETDGSISFADILERLHPTAAVAGTPRPQAMRLIKDLEGESRGRYSGPVGWFDSDGNGEFAIALRCGLFSDSQVILHSGAGIVAGSDPTAELEETRWKLQPMMDVLNLSG